MNNPIMHFLPLLFRVVRHNLKIIFAGRFLYFLLAAVLFYALITTLTFFGEDEITVTAAFYQLLFPGMLLIFYPTVFGIQSDADTRMLEILFGIPDYRYKIWLVRLVLIGVVTAVILAALTAVSSVVVISLPVWQVVWHLLFPLAFVGAMAFGLSTFIRNGNGTAVALVPILLGLWILSGILGDNIWNLFFSPFGLSEDMNRAVFDDMIIKNRAIIASGALLWLLWGLFNLQKRERFI